MVFRDMPLTFEDIRSRTCADIDLDVASLICHAIVESNEELQGLVNKGVNIDIPP
jgi:hypothetical protein